MLAKFCGSFTWTDNDGNIFKPNTLTILPAYTTFTVGSLPVPDQTPAGTEIDLTPPGITNGTSLVWIENKTGQDLNMAWNGNWFPHLAAGGLLLHVAPTAPAAGVIIGLRFMLTQIQSGIGSIYYAIGGT